MMSDDEIARDNRLAIAARDRAVLRKLRAFGGWARPMDVGGAAGSHHSATLRRLVRQQRAEKKLRTDGENGARHMVPSYLYRAARKP